jgi:hypothetical protein
MNCDWVKGNITLYLYHELSLAYQDQVEEHADSCESCARVLAHEKRFLQTLSSRPPAAAPDSLLAECRHDLMRSVYRADRAGDAAGSGLFAWWPGVERMLASLWRPAWQPVGALALLVAGFWMGHAFNPSASQRASGNAPMEASLIPTAPLESALAGIQSVAINPEQNQVEIVVEEVTRRKIIGRPQDPNIRKLLLSTMRGYPNSGVRLDTLEILTRGVDDSDVRATLLEAMVEDENPGVRLKALEAMRSRTADPAVRQALVKVLREDSNPGMRVHAIDLLIENPSRDLVGVLQDVIDSERNNYVRLQCSKTLQELNASVDRF